MTKKLSPRRCFLGKPLPNHRPCKVTPGDPAAVAHEPELLHPESLPDILAVLADDQGVGRARQRRLQKVRHLQSPGPKREPDNNLD